MRLLLDTSAVLHFASGTLSSAAADALRSGGLAVLSAVVPWEPAIKVKAGRLEVPLPPLDYCVSLARRHRLTLPRAVSPSRILANRANLRQFLPPVARPPTWESSSRSTFDRAIFQASPVELPDIDIHSL